MSRWEKRHVAEFLGLSLIIYFKNFTVKPIDFTNIVFKHCSDLCSTPFHNNADIQSESRFYRNLQVFTRPVPNALLRVHTLVTPANADLFSLQYEAASCSLTGLKTQTFQMGKRRSSKQHHSPPERFWKSQWRNSTFFSHGTPHSAGVMVLMSRFRGDVLNAVMCDNTTFILCNIYGHNSSALNKTLFAEVSDTIQCKFYTFQASYLIFCRF